MHTNMGRAGSDPERLTLLDPAAPAGRRDVGVPAGIYQAPSFSPDGKSIAYASSADTSSFSLHVRGADGTGDRTLAEASGGVFFAFSPDGTRVAWLAAEAFQPLPQGRLSVSDLSGTGPVRTVDEDPVLAFFWAPDGKTIAFLGVDAGGSTDAMFAQDPGFLYLRLMGLDPRSGKTWLIAAFPPSRGLLSVLPYFDQYQRSASLWSPDSRFIAFTAVAADGSPSLFVARADGNIKPRLVTRGDTAFWSGR